MLSVTVETTATTATVGFRHANPVGIVRYEASLYGQSAIRCSVAASAKPLQCTLKGLPEASEIYLEATACFASHCEPPSLGPWRTKMRGNIVIITFFYKSQTYKLGQYKKNYIVKFSTGRFESRGYFHDISEGASYSSNKFSSHILLSVY